MLTEKHYLQLALSNLKSLTVSIDTADESM